MIDPLIADKLKKLRDYYYDDDESLKWIDGVETRIKTLMVKENLMEHTSVQEIVADAKSRIVLINERLMNEKDMSQEVRTNLFHERDVHNFYLDRFEGRDIEKRYESVHTTLNEELKRIEQSS